MGQGSKLHGASRRAATFLALMMVAFVSACAAPRKTEPAVDAKTLTDDAFQVYLADLDLVTVGEAYRAMLILADGEDTCRTFEDRKQKLEERGITRSAWNLQETNVIDAGSVAYMVCRICKINGGLNSMLLGSWGAGDRRYALRELVYREMLEDTVAYQYMTGPALFALIRKADTIMEKKGLYESQKIDLSDETDRDEHGDLIVPETSRGQTPAKKE
jgi:hypothetical protein